jgi:hypothetical protein
MWEKKKNIASQELPVKWSFKYIKQDVLKNRRQERNKKPGSTKTTGPLFCGTYWITFGDPLRGGIQTKSSDPLRGSI